MKKLLILLLTFSFVSFSQVNKKILTSNQLAYTIAKNLTKNTDIEVKSVFDAYTDMNNQKVSFKNLENKEKIFKDAGVVITLSKTLDDDFLYEQARRYNIGIIEIDLTYSYRDLSSLVLSRKLDDKGEQIKQVWLDFNNLNKIVEIVKLDLSTIYPEYIEVFSNNANELKNIFMNISNDFIENILKMNKDIAVIQIGDNSLDYFLDSLEIYYENIPYEANKELIKKTIEETGANKIVSVKTLKKDIRKYLNDIGVKYVKLELGNIPRDEDGDEIMDDNGFIEILKDNTNKLINLFK